MTKIFVPIAVALFLISIAGCGKPANEVVIDPQMSPEKEQQLYDSYDKQMADSARNP